MLNLNDFYVYVYYCSSYVCFHVLYVSPSILCALCFCIVLCICLLMYRAVLFLTICVHVYGLLPPGDNTIAVNTYHITYHILSFIAHKRQYLTSHNDITSLTEVTQMAVAAGQ